MHLGFTVLYNIWSGWKIWYWWSLIFLSSSECPTFEVWICLQKSSLVFVAITKVLLSAYFTLLEKVHSGLQRKRDFFTRSHWLFSSNYVVMSCPRLFKLFVSLLWKLQEMFTLFSTTQIVYYRKHRTKNRARKKIKNSMV